jgi:hypothetical protein
MPCERCDARIWRGSGTSAGCDLGVTNIEVTARTTAYIDFTNELHNVLSATYEPAHGRTL